jgi:hypothetical protein
MGRVNAYLRKVDEARARSAQGPGEGEGGDSSANPSPAAPSAPTSEGSGGGAGGPDNKTVRTAEIIKERFAHRTRQSILPQGAAMKTARGKAMRSVTTLLSIGFWLFFAYHLLKSRTTVDPADTPLLTLADLAERDGYAGRPALIAVAGVVYDVGAPDGEEDGARKGEGLWFARALGRRLEDSAHLLEADPWDHETKGLEGEALAKVLLERAKRDILARGRIVARVEEEPQKDQQEAVVTPEAGKEKEL